MPVDFTDYNPTATEIKVMRGPPLPVTHLLETLIDREVALAAKVHPRPLKPRRWWEFWLAKPRHLVLEAETGKFFDAGDPGFLQWFWEDYGWSLVLWSALVFELGVLAYIVFG